MSVIIWSNPGYTDTASRSTILTIAKRLQKPLSHWAATAGDKLRTAFAKEFPKCLEKFTGFSISSNESHGFAHESFDNECTDERKNGDECTTDPNREEHFAGMQLLSQTPLIASSTPIVNRLETQQSRINIQPAFEIIKRLDPMESDLTMFKQSVISNIEQHDIQDLKSSVFDMIAKMKPDPAYASAVQTSSPSPDGLLFQQGFRNRSQSCADTNMQINPDNATNHNQPRSLEEVTCNHSTYEGFFNNSNSISGSSETLVKTVYSAARNEKASEAVGQPVPVIIANRNIDRPDE